MPGCIVSATTASFISVENRRRRATPVITSTFENVSDIGVCLGLSLGPPAIAGVRSKQGALQSRHPCIRLMLLANETCGHVRHRGSSSVRLSKIAPVAHQAPSHRKVAGLRNGRHPVVDRERSTELDRDPPALLFQTGAAR